MKIRVFAYIKASVPGDGYLSIRPYNGMQAGSPQRRIGQELQQR